METITQEFLISIGWSEESAKIIFDHKSDRGTAIMLNRIARKYSLGKLDVPIEKYPSQKKETIPSELRWEIWERDNFTCQHCGKRKNLSIDHITPESKGGTLDKKNLQTLCKSCNSKKGDR